MKHPYWADYSLSHSSVAMLPSQEWGGGWGGVGGAGLI